MTLLPPEIAQALARGATVLTGNQRAARALVRAHAEQARGQGLGSWQAPPICEWSAWLEGVYTKLATVENVPALLTPMQEAHLWQRVQVEDARGVVSPERLAELAGSAYRLLSDYDAHSFRRAPWAAAHEDAERFLAWASGFDELCAELDVTPRAGLAGLLTKYAGALPTPPALLLTGFDRLTPSQTALLGALSAAGVEITHAVSSEPAASQLVMEAADEAEELRACAHWLRERLSANPKQRIGVLVPELRGMRAELDRVFRRSLQPTAASRPAGPALPYEFSLGTPLATVPLVHAALALLRWLGAALPAAELTSLLLSDFLAASPEESLALAQTDAALRKRGLLTVELSLPTLLHHADQHADLLPPGVRDRLRAALEAFQQVRRPRGQGSAARRTHADWAEAVPALLDAAGWPGFRESSSVAFQARERWDALLVDLAAVSAVSAPVPWSRFAHELTQAARAARFAAESRDAPVQVLGIAEAAGLPFDAVWLLGANEGRWPAPGRLHPLLAPGLQRDAKMPHGSPEGDFALAEQQLRRVLASAPVFVASYARQIGGQPARPSPLLSAFAVAPEAADAPVAPRPRETRCEPDEGSAPPWPEERAAGGSEVLKYQAACGFQAFAAKRLGAHPLDEEAWGLDAGERATLLHRALERLWATGDGDAARLHTHAELLASERDGSLDEKLRAAIAHAFAGPMREAGGDPWRTAYFELEQQRLHTRLRRWLEEERKRPPFSVAALEQRIDNVEVGPLRLNLRVDRIDQIEGGRALLLDYKTADRVNIGLWSGDRPDEPQLPIYAQFGDIPGLAGIAFAQIRAGKGKTKLHALLEGAANGPAFTPELREGWTGALLSLAREFAAGEAPVNPKHGAQTCRVCKLYGICRVRSRADAVGGEDETEDGDA